ALTAQARAERLQVRHSLGAIEIAPAGDLGIAERCEELAHLALRRARGPHGNAVAALQPRREPRVIGMQMRHHDELERPLSQEASLQALPHLACGIAREARVDQYESAVVLDEP